MNRFYCVGAMSSFTYMIVMYMYIGRQLDDKLLKYLHQCLAVYYEG